MNNKNQEIRPNGSLGKLYDVLRTNLPGFVNSRGMLNVYSLSDKAGCTYQYLYKTFREEKLSANLANELLKISGDTKGTLTKEMLIEFILG